MCPDRVWAVPVPRTPVSGMQMLPVRSDAQVPVTARRTDPAQNDTRTALSARGTRGTYALQGGVSDTQDVQLRGNARQPFRHSAPYLGARLFPALAAVPQLHPGWGEET